MNRNFVIFTFLLGIFLVTGCANFQAGLGEEFMLRVDETVNIKSEPLKITLIMIGREWTEDAEYAFADLAVKINGEEGTISLNVGDQWIVGGFEITLLSADPFGDTGCKLVVKSSDG